MADCTASSLLLQIQFDRLIPSSVGRYTKAGGIGQTLQSKFSELQMGSFQPQRYIGASLNLSRTTNISI
jgi:hypothetical protein